MNRRRLARWGIGALAALGLALILGAAWTWHAHRRAQPGVGRRPRRDPVAESKTGSALSIT